MNRASTSGENERWISRIGTALAICGLAGCAVNGQEPAEPTGEFISAISATQSKSGGTGATSATFDNPQIAGDLNVVAIGWGDDTSTVASVGDTRGNVYTLAAPMMTVAGSPPLRQAIYYAKKIAGGANTVHVVFNGTPFFPDLRVVEYSGLDQTAPLDVKASASGNGVGGAQVATASATTTFANELLFGAGMTTNVYGGAGTNFTQRVITSDGNIAEDRVVASKGTYTASALLAGGSQTWLMQMLTFKAAAGAVAKAPILSAIAPANGSTVGGTAITLSGSNFVSGATATVCGTAATSIAFVSSSKITAKTPPHAAGACAVVVKNPDGQSSTLANGFTYVSGPCVPTTCAARGDDCGSISNGCGGTLNCGSCTSPATCGGSGTPNVCGTSAGAMMYSTNFDLTETPLSEGGAWTNNGLDWTFAASAGGFAFGTQSSGSPNDDDSIAVLSNVTFPANYAATAVIHRDPSLAGNTHEVELLLRFSITPHNAHGYECNLAFDGGYTQIVSWNGALNDFTMLSDAQPRPALDVKEGSVFSAKIVGNVITVFLDGVQINTYTDTSLNGGARWPTGNPGVGFWHGDNNGTYGFTNYSVTSL